MRTEKQFITQCGNYVIWVILNSTLQIAQVSCFMPNCYRGFIDLWSTLLSCFGIRMLQSYWNIAKFLEVCGQGNFLTVRMFCSTTLCKLHLHWQHGCGRSYLLDLPVCAILECSCLQRRSSGEIFRITQYSELPRLTLTPRKILTRREWLPPDTNDSLG